MVDILREYGRYFIGDRYADVFRAGAAGARTQLAGRRWSTNAGVDTTLQQFQAMERAASPQVLLNWRFQQALYRAYYDAYDAQPPDLRNRARGRGDGQALARSAAAWAVDRHGARQSRSWNARSPTPVAQAWRARVFELAEALYQSIRMQLSVPRYKAIAVGRGANLDTIDVPLNNRPWLTQQLRRDPRAADGSGAARGDRRDPRTGPTPGRAASTTTWAASPTSRTSSGVWEP